MDFVEAKYGEYPEYHTSGDDFNVVTQKGLKGSLEVFIDLINGLKIHSLSHEQNINVNHLWEKETYIIIHPQKLLCLER